MPTPSYLTDALFGTGRVGANIAAYLRSIGHAVTAITRADDETTATAAIKGADIVLAAIPDSALGDWRKKWDSAIADRPAVHFSGALVIEHMEGVHPLYSFPPTLLPVETMRAIAFALSDTARDFQALFPGAANPTFRIEDKARAHYHALAVLSGNLSAFLWNQTAKSFETRYGPAAKDALGAYFHSIVERYLESPDNSLTGPVVRRDEKTVTANLAALSDEPRLQGLYNAFLAAAWPERDQDKP